MHALCYCGSIVAEACSFASIKTRQQSWLWRNCLSCVSRAHFRENLDRRFVQWWLGIWSFSRWGGYRETASRKPEELHDVIVSAALEGYLQSPVQVAGPNPAARGMQVCVQRSWVHTISEWHHDNHSGKHMEKQPHGLLFHFIGGIFKHESHCRMT